jgi:transposase
MKKEVKLIKKVKRLLKRLGCSTYRHHFGPKTYKFYVHIAALLVRCYCRLSYRRTAYFMDLIGLECPSKSALQYTASRISSNFWNKMLELTSGIRHKIVALDATGFSRTNPSYHYLNRIKGTMPKVYVKLNAGLSVVNRKFCAAKIKILPSHEVKEAINLLKKTKVEIVVADKGYDANYIHEFCVSRNIEAHIPMVNHGKAKHNMMSERRLAAKNFDENIYHQRELIESCFGSIKKKFGSSVNSKKAQTIKSDIYGMLTCHNIFLFLMSLRTSPVKI